MGTSAAPTSPARSATVSARDGRRVQPSAAAFPLVSDRERRGPLMPADAAEDLELMWRRVIREETGLSPVAPAEKWRDGTLVLRPGSAGLHAETWPVAT